MYTYFKKTIKIFDMNILFFIQILLESLPISSSGHLYILKMICPKLNSLTIFEEFLSHIPTLFLLIILSRKVFLRWIDTYSVKRLSYDLFCLSFATGITLLAYLLKWYFVSKFGSLFVIPFYYLPFLNSLLLFRMHDFNRNKESFEFITVKKAFWIGVIQSFALISGISRFGVTLWGGLFLGFSKRYAMVISIALQSILCFGAAFGSFVCVYFNPAILSGLSIKYTDFLLLFLTMGAAYFLLRLVIHLHISGKLWNLYLYSLFLGIILTIYHFLSMY